MLEDDDSDSLVPPKGYFELFKTTQFILNYKFKINQVIGIINLLGVKKHKTIPLLKSVHKQYTSLIKDCIESTEILKNRRLIGKRIGEIRKILSKIIAILIETFYHYLPICYREDLPSNVVKETEKILKSGNNEVISKKFQELVKIINLMVKQYIKHYTEKSIFNTKSKESETLANRIHKLATDIEVCLKKEDYETIFDEFRLLWILNSEWESFNAEFLS